MQAVVTTATEPPVTLQEPVVVTSSKVNASPQILKVAPGGQGKKPVGKGKGNKPLDKGKEKCCRCRFLILFGINCMVETKFKISETEPNFSLSTCFRQLT